MKFIPKFIKFNIYIEDFGLMKMETFSNDTANFMSNCLHYFYLVFSWRNIWHKKLYDWKIKIPFIGMKYNELVIILMIIIETISKWNCTISFLKICKPEKQWYKCLKFFQNAKPSYAFIRSYLTRNNSIQIALVIANMFPITKLIISNSISSFKNFKNPSWTVFEGTKISSMRRGQKKSAIQKAWMIEHSLITGQNSLTAIGWSRSSITRMSAHLLFDKNAWTIKKENDNVRR